ncbi:MAG: transglutaminase family protein [Desulfobacterales bacterium]
MWPIRAAEVMRAFPVNAYEAEGRRVSRFFSIGHTPGVLDPIPEKTITRDFPAGFAPQ